jgi:hypothetical protein
VDASHAELPGASSPTAKRSGSPVDRSADSAARVTGTLSRAPPH